MDPCLNKEQAARDAIEGLLTECADAKCDRAIARTALAEKAAECEQLQQALTYIVGWAYSAAKPYGQPEVPVLLNIEKCARRALNEETD